MRSHHWIILLVSLGMIVLLGVGLGSGAAARPSAGIVLAPAIAVPANQPAADQAAPGQPLLTPLPTVTPTCLPATPGPWALRNPAPVAVYGPSMTSDGAYAYFFGGDGSATGLQHHTRRYDPSADTWTTLFPMPDEQRSAAAVYGGNGRIYVINGIGFFNSTPARNRIYDIANDSWTLGAPPPFGLFDQIPGAYNGRIYLVGGQNTNATVYQTLWVYEIASNTWDTTLAPPPQPRAAAGSGVINGRLYVAGGRDPFSNYLNTLYIYDIATNTWTSGATLPQAVSYPGSAVRDGKLWVFGGTGAAGPLNVTQIYDPASNTWSLGPTLTVARSQLGGTAVGPYVIAAGGASGSAALATVEVSTNPLPCRSTPTATATPAPIGTPCLVLATVTGAITSGDPTLSNPLYRDGGVASCAIPKPCAGPTGGGPYHYDLYTYTNTSSSPRCVLVSLNATNCGTGRVSAYGYLGVFNPASLCTSYAGDDGTSDLSQQFSISVPAGATYNVVVVEAPPAQGCPSYTVTLTSCGAPPSPTPTCIPVLRGHLTYEGQPQPDARNVQPVTLKLAQGGTVTTFTASADAGGNITVPLSGLPTGVYNWWVKSPQYLANGGTFTFNNACSTAQELGTLRAGDVNNDNTVDISDFSLLRASFGRACGDAAYAAQADLNHDCLVDINDFSLQRANFGQVGAPEPLGPGVARRAAP